MLLIKLLHGMVPVFFSILISSIAFAQRGAPVQKDTLEIREAIYQIKKGQHEKAKQLCQSALRKYPREVNAEILLGRLYSWDQQFDSARIYLQDALRQQPDNEKGLEAIINVELWSGHLDQALAYCDKALSLYPNSESLLIKKAKVYNKQAKYNEADKLVEQVLALDPNSREAIKFREYLKKKALNNTPGKNRIGLSYQYDHFSNTYTPWSFASLYYARKGSAGALLASVNYANRFHASGLQYALDLYPKISSNMRAFIGGAYSKDSVFPTYYAGAGLYYKLFKKAEIDLGARYLNFSALPDPIIIYTGAFSMSFGKAWASFRTYLTPQQAKVNTSYYLTLKYYLANPENNITLILSTGLSPHDYVDPISGKSYNYPTQSNRIRAVYQTAFLSPQNLLKFSAGYEKRSYHTGLSRNRVSVGLGFERLF